jgi:alkyl sulfatase BDS1-like metallo-beta-lactamase superfamily hydrolase
MRTRLLGATSACLLGVAAQNAFAQAVADAVPRPATPVTERANAAVRKSMTFNDRQDFEDATRGRLAGLSDPLVKGADGRIVWDARCLATSLRSILPSGSSRLELQAAQGR